MGNLGFYQTFTTISKAVGGPKRLLAMIGGGGLAVGVAIGANAKPVAVKVAEAVKNLKTKSSTKGFVYIVSSEPSEEDAAEMNGLAIHVGDQFRVVENDGDAICIEVLGNTDNPYYLSGELLASISDFRSPAAAADEG